MKSTDHPTHVMKRQSAEVEEVIISSFPLRPHQKRLITKFTCECNEEDVFYRQADHPKMMAEEYTKPAKK